MFKRRMFLISSLLALFAIATLGSLGITGVQQPGPKTEDPKDLLESQLFAQMMIWPDEDGRPKGLPESKWKPVTKELGVMWQRRDRGPDRLLWVVLDDGQWRGATSVDFVDFNSYEQGLKP